MKRSITQLLKPTVSNQHLLILIPVDCVNLPGPKSWAKVRCTHTPSPWQIKMQTCVWQAPNNTLALGKPTKLHSICPQTLLYYLFISVWIVINYGLCHKKIRANNVLWPRAGWWDPKWALGFIKYSNTQFARVKTTKVLQCLPALPSLLSILIRV